MSSVPFSPGSPASSTVVNVPSGNPVAPPAASPFIKVQQGVDFLTETQLSLPVTAVRFHIRAKSSLTNSNLFIAFVAGATMGTDTITLARGTSYSEVDLQLQGVLNIFVRSDNLPLDVELIYWTT